jgi:hypothetical protein
MSTIIRITRPPTEQTQPETPGETLFDGDVSTNKGCQDAKNVIQALHDET